MVECCSTQWDGSFGTKFMSLSTPRHTVHRVTRWGLTESLVTEAAPGVKRTRRRCASRVRTSRWNMIDYSRNIRTCRYVPAMMQITYWRVDYVSWQLTCTIDYVLTCRITLGTVHKWHHPNIPNSWPPPSLFSTFSYKWLLTSGRNVQYYSRDSSLLFWNCTVAGGMCLNSIPYQRYISAEISVEILTIFLIWWRKLSLLKIISTEFYLCRIFISAE